MERVGPSAGGAGARRGGIFYGWYMVAGGAVLQAVSAGLNFYGFSAFFSVLTREFDWGRGILSGVFSLSRIEAGLLGPVEGFLIDKFGPRKMMLIGIPLAGIGFLFLSRVNSLLELYLVYIVFIAIGFGLSSFAPIGAVVANWFVRKRGLAFGIVMAGVAAGGATVVPVLGWWLDTFGWRNAAVASGVLVIVVGIPIALIMRHRPEQYGYLPDGAEPASNPATSVTATQVTEGGPPAAEQAEFSPLQCLKTPAFWCLGLSLALRGIVITGVTIHFVAMMVDRGLSLMVATALLGAVASLSLIGRLGVSWLGDLVDRRFLLAVSLGVLTLTMLGLSQAQSFALVLPILIIYAIAYGGVVVLPLGIQADYFGRSAFATIQGMLHLVQVIGTVAGPIFAGFVYDATQSYDLAFLGFAAAGLLATLCVIGIRKPAAPPSIPASA